MSNVATCRRCCFYHSSSGSDWCHDGQGEMPIGRGSLERLHAIGLPNCWRPFPSAPNSLGDQHFRQNWLRNFPGKQKVVCREMRFSLGNTRRPRMTNPFSSIKKGVCRRSLFLSPFFVQERTEPGLSSRPMPWRRTCSRRRSSPTRLPNIRTIQTMGSNAQAASSLWRPLHARW